MIQSAILVVVSLAISVYLWNVMDTLQQIAKDLRIIAGRYDSKPPAEDPEQLIDA